MALSDTIFIVAGILAQVAAAAAEEVVNDSNRALLLANLSWQCRLKTCRLEAPKETTHDMSNDIGDMSKDMSRH